jgi:hypothetical protein
MNEIEAWYEILKSWEKVKRMKKLNQELYDILFGAIGYIIEYSKKYGIPIPKKDEMERMANRIHYLMDEIEPPTESQQRNKTPDKSTEPKNILKLY